MYHRLDWVCELLKPHPMKDKGIGSIRILWSSDLDPFWSSMLYKCGTKVLYHMSTTDSSMFQFPMLSRCEFGFHLSCLCSVISRSGPSCSLQGWSSRVAGPWSSWPFDIPELARALFLRKRINLATPRVCVNSLMGNDGLLVTTTVLWSLYWACQQYIPNVNVTLTGTVINPGERLLIFEINKQTSTQPRSVLVENLCPQIEHCQSMPFYDFRSMICNILYLLTCRWQLTW